MKKLWMILVVVAWTVMMAGAAEAASVTKYGVWVDGVQVTSANSGNITGTAVAEVVYSPSDKTIMLKTSGNHVIKSTYSTKITVKPERSQKGLSVTSVGDIEIAGEKGRSISTGEVYVNTSGNLSITGDYAGYLLNEYTTIEASGDIVLCNNGGGITNADMSFEDVTCNSLTIKGNCSNYMMKTVYDLLAKNDVVFLNPKGKIAESFYIEGARNVTIEGLDAQTLFGKVTIIYAFGDVSIKNPAGMVSNGGIIIGDIDNKAQNVTVEGASEYNLLKYCTIYATGDINICNTGYLMYDTSKLYGNNINLKLSFDKASALAGDITIRATGDVYIENEAGIITAGTYKFDCETPGKLEIYGNSDKFPLISCADSGFHVDVCDIYLENRAQYKVCDVNYSDLTMNGLRKVTDIATGKEKVLAADDTLVGDYRVITNEPVIATDALQAKNGWSGILLDWNTPHDAGQSVRILRTEVGKSEGIWLSFNNGEQSYYDKNAEHNKEYEYKLYYYAEKLGCIGKSYAIQRYVKIPVITSVANSVDGAKISWSGVEGATSYHVYRKDGQSGKWTWQKQVKDLTYLDKTVENGKVYYYAIKAEVKVEENKWLSASSSAKNTVFVKPVYISSLSSNATKAMTVKTSTSSIWAGFEIQYSTTPAFTDATTKTLYINGYSVTKTITGLTSGKTYYVRVRASKTMGGYTFYSNYSATKNVVVK